MSECLNCGEECDDGEEYCEYCLEHQCAGCGTIVKELDDNGNCNECRHSAWIDMQEACYER